MQQEQGIPGTQGLRQGACLLVARVGIIFTVAYEIIDFLQKKKEGAYLHLLVDGFLGIHIGGRGRSAYIVTGYVGGG